MANDLCDSKFTYQRTGGDESYRRVSLTSEQIPNYQDFKSFPETVSYTTDVVLEVKRSDGTTQLCYGDEKRTTLNVISDKNKSQLRLCNLKNHKHMARLYLRVKEGNREGCFKLPVVPFMCSASGTPTQTVVVNLAKIPEDYTVVGDKYIDKVYKIQ